MLLRHNGGIPEFAEYKVQLLQSLSPKTAAMISGTTDTEHIAGRVSHVFVSYMSCEPNASSTTNSIFYRTAENGSKRRSNARRNTFGIIEDRQIHM